MRNHATNFLPLYTAPKLAIDNSEGESTHGSSGDLLAMKQAAEGRGSLAPSATASTPCPCIGSASSTLAQSAADRHEADGIGGAFEDVPDPMTAAAEAEIEVS